MMPILIGLVLGAAAAIGAHAANVIRDLRREGKR